MGGVSEQVPEFANAEAAVLSERLEREEGISRGRDDHPIGKDPADLAGGHRRSCGRSGSGGSHAAVAPGSTRSQPAAITPARRLIVASVLQGLRAP